MCVYLLHDQIYTSLVGNYESVDILSRNPKYSFKYQLIRWSNTSIIESKEAFASENFKGVMSQLGHLSIQAKQKENHTHTHTHTCIFILEKKFRWIKPICASCNVLYYWSHDNLCTARLLCPGKEKGEVFARTKVGWLYSTFLYKGAKLLRGTFSRG